MQPQSDTNHTIVWEPIPRSSQELALDSRAHVTLYHGTRGPGKTACQLMRFRRRVGMGYGEFWRGIIFDKHFKNLSDLVAQSKRFFSKFDDGAKFLSSASEFKWVWPTGEELLFRHGFKKDDYDQFHGHEYPFIGWNELTKQPSPDFYFKMMSCNRTSFVPSMHSPIDNETGKRIVLPDIPLEVFATTNSNGPGYGWVKRLFIDPVPAGHILRREVKVFNPRTQAEEIITKTQVAIFGSYRENIYLPPEYVAELESITDENLKAAWLYGSWDVMSGGAFDDVWRHRIHVIPRFNIPAGWRVDRSFDWGSTHPFSVGWFAEANGESVELPDGRIFTPVRGSLILCHEWYGSKDVGTNIGLKMPAAKIAEGIKNREIELMKNGFFTKQPLPGPADNQIRDVREADVETIEQKMASVGIRWTQSDKSPGSRKIGMDLTRERLSAAISGEGPALYIMAGCTAAITLLPTMPRDEENPDDVDTDAEDHAYDMIRYRVLRSSNRFATKLDVSFPL